MLKLKYVCLLDTRPLYVSFEVYVEVEICMLITRPLYVSFEVYVEVEVQIVNSPPKF